MSIGRIAALLGSLSPSAAEQAQTEASIHEPAVAAPDSSISDNNPGANPGNESLAQIQAVIGAIRQLNDNAGQDGAAMAFSQSGSTLKDSVSGLAYLVQNAGPLPDGVKADVAQLTRDVEVRVQTVRDGLEQRLAHTQKAADQQRLSQIAGAFVTEMQSALTTLKNLSA